MSNGPCQKDPFFLLVCLWNLEVLITETPYAYLQKWDFQVGVQTKTDWLGFCNRRSSLLTDVDTTVFWSDVRVLPTENFLSLRVLVSLFSMFWDPKVDHLMLSPPILSPLHTRASVESWTLQFSGVWYLELTSFRPKPKLLTAWPIFKPSIVWGRVKWPCSKWDIKWEVKNKEAFMTS